MRSTPVAKRQIWTAPTNSCWPATHSELQYSPHCRWFHDQPITILESPLVEGEWDMMRTFVRRMEREDLRLRFGHPFDVQDQATLRRLFDVKAGAGEMAWVLDETAAIAGIAHRIMVSPAEAEIALIVRSDLQRRGIGELLLREVLARSARQGVKTLSASVLRENHATLRLAAKIGFAPRQASTWNAWAIELALALGQTTDGFSARACRH
jgi:GNAT superfamily N-acetyltransferase